MSSYRVQVSVSDRELQEMDRKIRDTANYVALRRQETERLRRQAEARAQEIAAMRAANERAVQDALHTLERSYEDALRQLHDGTEAELRQRSARFADGLQALAEDARRRDVRITALDRQAEQTAQEMNRVFNALAAQSASAHERAETTARQLHGLADRIAQMHPEAFAANEYARLTAMLDNMDASLRRGDDGAAIILSQNGILDATRLMGRLSAANTRFAGLLEEAQTRAARLEERFGLFAPEAGGAVRIELDGEQYEQDYDISRWSHGRFDELRTQFEGLRQTLTQAQQTPCTPEAAAHLSEELDRLSAALDACDRQAREELIASEHVCRMAETLHDSLSSAGWALEDSGFRDDDDRKPYTLQYRDAAGNVLSMVVGPGEANDRPEFAMEVYSDNPVLADSAKRGVNAALTAEGVQIEHTEVRSDCHRNPTAEDFVRNTVQEFDAASARRRMQQTRQA